MLFDLSNKNEYNEAINSVKSFSELGKTIEIKIKNKQRTHSQNNALHLMFTQLASELNDHGLYMMKVLKHSAEIEWTPETVKVLIWKPLMNAIVNKDSTSAMTRDEVDKVFKVLHKHFNEKLGLNIEFPSIETLINKKRFF